MKDNACPQWAFLSCSGSFSSIYLNNRGSDFCLSEGSTVGFSSSRTLEYCSSWFYMPFGAFNMPCVGFCVLLAIGWLIKQSFAYTLASVFCLLLYYYSVSCITWSIDPGNSVGLCGVVLLMQIKTDLSALCVLLLLLWVMVQSDSAGNFFFIWIGAIFLCLVLCLVDSWAPPLLLGNTTFFLQ